MENSNESTHIVSVIIPTLNRSSLTAVLNALDNQTRKPDEVIVMEDKNCDGPSPMRNMGVEKSKGDLIAFLDDDVIPEKDWLEIFINEMERYNADGVSSNYTETDPLLHEIRQRRKFPDKPVADSNALVGLGGNCMYKRSCLEECKKRDGYIFNPRLRIGEDVELQWRQRFYGFNLVYVINNVKHLKELNPLQFIKFQFNRGKSIERLYSIRNSFKSIELGPSLLWNEPARKSPKKKWIIIFSQKILGPFDFKSFSKFSYFVLFWMGEKSKSLGFLFSLINNKL